jgi:uncharacterized protein (DUF305 family)
MKIVTVAFAFCIALWASAERPVAAGNSDAEFLAATSAAMTKMMLAMESPNWGDADEDFVRAMVPHHQGAIDMAQAELQYGRSERLRRIAQEIIITQQEEISAMRRDLVREPLAQPDPSPRGTPQ